MKIPRSHSIGQYIKRKRVESGITQADLAKRLGYTAQFVTNWERGVSSPPANTLRKIVAILKIPEQEILDLLCQESIEFWRKALLGNARVSKRKAG